MIDLPASRAAAIKTEAPFYFTGKPCVHGHIAKRYPCGGCVECVEASAKNWHAANPERVKAKDARWAAANPDKLKAKSLRRTLPENIAATRARTRAQYQANRLRRVASMKKWREAHRDEARAATARWGSEHPDKVQANVRRRRARKNGATDHCSPDEISRLRAKVGDRCAWCARRRRLTIDHIKPLCKGGSDSIKNIQFLCKPCNSMKGAKDPVDFARYAGRLI